MSAIAPLALRDRLRLSRFLRGEGPQTGPVTLTRRRVFILPTRYGWLFGLMLLVMWLGSVNYNNGLGFALTFLLGGLAMVSILHTYRNLSGLTFSAGRVAPVFAGEQARFAVNVDNPGAAARASIALQLPGEAPLVYDVERQTNVTLTRLAPRRGRWPMGRFTVSTVFPLGLFRAWAHLDLDIHCLIYPRPAAPQPLPEAQPASSESSRGRGTEDFAGVRDYQSGDSLRHVHWKALARQDALLTKQFSGGEVNELWLDWHRLPPALDTESRLSLLCRFVLDAHGARLRYGLRLPGKEISPNDGEAHQRACLEALALFEWRA
ncbi:MAG: DUF58 domain-containing protein [Gammaproteobacteria bacterium]|nr:MAG: DUF58 domain-containing protein [Gammaproteobacteria bacterium]